MQESKIEQTSSSKIKDSEDKITINNSADLYKIPISVLKRTKVYNFQGKYYEKIYNEALDIEKEKAQKKPPKERTIPSYKSLQPEIPKIESPNINETQYENKTNQETKNITNNYNKPVNEKYNYGGYTNFTYNSNQMLRGDYLIKNILFEIEYQTSMGQEVGIIGSLNELGRWNQDKVLKLNWDDGVWRKQIPYINGTDFEFKFILISNGKVIKWEEGNNRPFKYNNVCLNLRNGNKQYGLITIWNLNHMTIEYEIRTNNLKIICDWNKK